MVDAVKVESTGRSETITGDVNGQDEEDDMIGATRWQKAGARKKKLVEEQALQDGQKTIAEMKSDETEVEEQETILKPQEKPISRAERRRRIKEQILADGEGEGFKGYKRRMW